MASDREFGALLFAILASTFPSPRDQATVWQHFCLNSLARLRDQSAKPFDIPLPSISYIAPFAAIYRRIFELYRGQSLLDVGCSFGFLPVLMAERAPDSSIVGCDSNPDAIGFSSELVRATNTQQVTWMLKDVLAPTFPALGRFDTVTAIHLLEHLREQELPLALTHLLQVTSKRLLIAVPYEKVAQPLYGHRQAFTPEKLHYWGNWGVEALGGAGHYWCEDVMGGLLIVDRSAEYS